MVEKGKAATTPVIAGPHNSIAMVRSWPNIALTGTPGTGKSTHAQLIVQAVPEMRHLDMGPIVKENGFHVGFDEEYQTYDVDEDSLLDYIEPLTGKVAPEPLDDEESDEREAAEASRESDDTSDERGGLLLDWHSCEAYPERWVDLVVVLRCNHEILWKRLEKR
ncbi:hypothetical protein L7F22_029650 [Adiantum nelumboides]|nr:hypothetical protein [Adiantum nelumboides]